jgi:NAD(P)-dependent dehydrogenase (short-subunit alcohol dehydrogenase family)
MMVTGGDEVVAAPPAPAPTAQAISWPTGPVPERSRLGVLLRDMEQVWFITGSSRGLGRALVQAALGAGDRVAATARQPAQLGELVARHGERLHTIALDVTDDGAARSAISEARRRFGRLDVVVNNAGYANVSPIETADDADFRAQFETNFWGVYNVSKAAIPVLREQGGGTVIQISSVGGRVGGSPGIASYQAAKFAIDGFSRVLQAETAPFGVRVMVVEPSGFRTDWAGSSMTVHDIPEAYAPTVGVMNSRVRQSTAGAAGDPARAAEIIVQVVKRRDIPYHLPLGANAVEASVRLDEQLLAADRKWRQVSRSADFGEPYPPRFPADVPK